MSKVSRHIGQTIMDSKLMEESKEKLKSYTWVDRLIIAGCAVFLLLASGFGLRAVQAVIVIERQDAVDVAQNSRIAANQEQIQDNTGKVISLEQRTDNLEHNQRANYQNMQTSLDQIQRSLDTLTRAMLEDNR